MGLTTKNFWDQLSFSYVVTYSFNRGVKLSRLRQAASQLFKCGRRSLLTASASQLPGISAELRQLEKTHGLDLMPLTQGLLAFHITASPVAVIKSGVMETQELERMMQTPVAEQLHWMCWPVYRDALAFYDDQDNLIRVLNICFGCDRMLTDAGEEVQADTATYQALRKLLTQLGHSITDAE